jgi:hypothetical protein
MGIAIARSIRRAGEKNLMGDLWALFRAGDRIVL